MGVAEVARLPGRTCRKSGDFRYTRLQTALAARVRPVAAPALVKLGQEGLPLCWRARRRVGDGANRPLGTVDDFKVPVVGHLADADGFPGMLRLGVDAHQPFGGLEALVLDGLTNCADVIAAGSRDRLGPQMNAEIRGFHGVGREALRTVAGAESVHERLILRRLNRREIVPRGVITAHLPDTDRA